jgi:hypothetical protein
VLVHGLDKAAIVGTKHLEGDEKRQQSARDTKIIETNVKKRQYRSPDKDCDD